MRKTAAAALGTLVLTAGLAGCSTGQNLTEEVPEPAELAQMVADCRDVGADAITATEFDRTFDLEQATVTGYTEPGTWDIEIPATTGTLYAACNWTSAVATVEFR